MEETKESYYEMDTNNNWVLKTFFRMFLGLLATALVAFYTYQSGLYIKIASSVSYGILAIVEVVVVLIFSALFRKAPPIVVTVLYFIYAVLNGVTMSIIFAAFSMGTIFYAFLTSSALFGGLCAYGYFTKKDMTRFGRICMIALVIGLVMSIINLFLGNTIVDIVIDWIILAIFVGITAYDINKLKNMHEEIDCDDEKLYVYGAMELYLDFINIFIRILSIMGRRRD